ncbi:MAG: amino acid adenylation domain-containing protein, partial [Desulfamplus sp.]|nr:amino acid adenylation domain-containing protein [Desulfamplus sp.]
GGHPKLFAPPELELLLFNTLDERKAVCSGRDSFWLEGTLRAVMEILGIDGDAAKAMMAEREERGMSVKDFYAQMQEWLGDRILVDKSPSYALDLSVLQRAEEYFDNPLYIHLHRHPYGMIHSFEEAKLHQIFFRHPHNFSPRQLAELIWTHSHRNISRFLATVPPERQINIGFAEMTGSPEETVNKLCRFIGIDFAPEMLQLYEAKERQKRMTDGIHAESKMLGDIKFHTHKRIDPSAAQRWRNKYQSDFLGEPSWDMALALGYTREFLNRDGTVNRNKILNRDDIVNGNKIVNSDDVVNNNEMIVNRDEIVNSDGVMNGAGSPTGHSIALKIDNVDGGLPLSFAQQRLWFLDQLEGAGTAYNMPVAVRVKGNLQTDILADTFRAITERHEGLRSRFETVDGVPVVRISPKAPEMVTIDISQMDNDQKRERLNELLESDAAARFDLTSGPLFRSTLIILSDQEFVILVNMHHIVSDGWSMGILVREWEKLYNSITSNINQNLIYSPQISESCSQLSESCSQRPESSPKLLELGELYNLSSPQGLGLCDLPLLTFHYVDYARRQRCWAAQAGLQQDIDYWKRQLAGAPALLELPTDQQRPPIQTFNGKTIEFSISPELAQSLRHIAKDAGATLYMVLLSAFGVLLMRYSGQQDVVIGSPTANRTTKEVESLIGFFVNTLVMRLSVEPELTFSKFLSNVRATALEAYSHQEIPFEKLVEEIKPERNLSYSPLFQVMFSMQSAPATAPKLQGLEVKVIEQPTNISKYDLTLAITEIPEKHLNPLAATIEFNTDLFNTDTIERMSGHFVRLLEAIVEDANSTLARLPLLTDSEYRYIVNKLNNTFRTLPETLTIHGLFEEQAARTPDAVALQFGYKASGEDHQYFTYDQLNRRANQIAHLLRGMGVTSQAMVAIAIERSPDMVAGLLGILKAGATYVPLDPTYPEDRIAYILDNAGVEVLLTQSSRLSGLPEHKGKTVCIDMQNCTESDCSMPLEGSPDYNPTGYEVSPENLAYVIYTSGSTGNPKGVMIPHGAAVNFINSMATTPGITSDDRLLAVTTISFDIAVLELYMPLTVGARVVVATEEMTRDGEMLMEILSSQSITMMQATPATWRLMLSSGWQGTKNLKILCGGEALPGTLAAQLLPRCESLWNLYGPTETTVWSTLHKVTDTSGAKAQPIGRPIDNTSLYILDKAMNPVPAGVAGELYIGGSGLARGYWKRPELTAEKFIPDPFAVQEQSADSLFLNKISSPDHFANLDKKINFQQFISESVTRMYLTGDLARYRPDGVVEYLGRIDHQIKFRGFRIELGEIEHALSSLEGVEVGAVVAEKESDSSIKRLVAFYVPKSEIKFTPAELRSALQKRLPDYMVPGMFVEVDTMPLTPNGKIDRRSLSVPDSMTMTGGYGKRDGSYGKRDGTSGKDDFVGARDTLEVQLIRIWEEVLDIQPVGIRDNFFDLGGHSLIAVRLMAQITRQFKKHLPLSALFQGATVEAMARLLREDKAEDAWSSLVPIQPDGNLPPFFCIPGAGGNVVYLHDLAKAMKISLRPFYGLQPPGLDGTTQPHADVESLAAHYISAIKEIQPDGPYFLGGHSFGGLVAFEMARQLFENGESIAKLVLIDTPAPKFFEPTGTDWDEARWLTQVADIAGHQYGTSLDIKYETLQKLSPEKQLVLVHEKLKECDILPPDAKLVHFRGFIEVYKANLRAMYRPFEKISQPFEEMVESFNKTIEHSEGLDKFYGHVMPVQFILLRSKDEQPENIAGAQMHKLRAMPDLGWSECVALPVNVVAIPGDHLTMLRPPNVAKMADVLTAFLKKGD